MSLKSRQLNRCILEYVYVPLNYLVEFQTRLESILPPFFIDLST